LNPFSIICPKGVKFETMKSAPAPNIIYPNIGPRVPVKILCPGFFSATNPINETIPNNIAG